MRPFGRAFGLVREIVAATLRDGALHAGNFAYLALVTLFPAAILVTSVAGLAGRSEAGHEAIAGFLSLLPPAVSADIGPLVAEVVEGRAGGALGLSVAVGLWTVSGFLETLRGLILKANGLAEPRAFWKTRLLLAGASLVAAGSVLLSVAVALLLSLARKLLASLAPGALVSPVAWLAPPLVAFAALWLLFAGLTPRDAGRGPFWPGALVVILLWSVAAALFGPVVGATGCMARTYGALAGVMLALLFFHLIGFALVLGAETNAALSRRRRASLEAPDTKGTIA